MFVRADEDSPSAIQRAWAEFETAVGLKGRKFFGAFYPKTQEYRVCTLLKEDDDPAALGFQTGTLPGGAYRRTRLQGEPPAIYEQIGPAAEALDKQGAVDLSRPTIEFYRSRDTIDVLVPIT
jgi:hypothetical protein